MNLSLVSAEDFSLLIYEITRFGSLSGILFNKGRIIPVRHKADILAVRFIGIDKALLLCNLTDFFLGVGAKRKERMGKLILRHGVEYIALILGRIQPLPEKETSGLRILLSAGIVTACNVFTSEFSCLIEKC